MPGEANFDAASPARAPSPGGGVLFFPQPCTREKGSGCMRCQIACPMQAIGFPDGGTPVIDAQACNRCGICIGICDAFGLEEVTTYDFAKRLARISRRDGRVYLCCNEDIFEGLTPDGNVVVLNCLASLPPELLTHVLAQGADVVIAHDTSYCEDCTVGGRLAGRLWQRSVELAQQWSGRTISASQEIPEKEGLLDQMAAPDRRELFTGIISAAGNVASGQYREGKSTVVEDFLARRERMRATAMASPRAGLFLDDDARRTSRESHFTRKKLMEEAIAADPEIAKRYGAAANAHPKGAT